jgi:hypothetical protein
MYVIKATLTSKNSETALKPLDPFVLSREGVPFGGQPKMYFICMPTRISPSALILLLFVRF